MPKMKSHSGLKKRVRRTASGKLKVEGSRRWTPNKATNKQRRDARNGTVLEGTTCKKFNRLLGK